MKSFGYFFEDFAVRDLSVYSDTNKYSLSHYRDSFGQEVDAIVEAKDGTYGAVEIKLASDSNIKEGIKSLLLFEKKMLKSNLPLPKFKMVLTSHGSCFKSEEGVYIVPINLLKN